MSRAPFGQMETHTARKRHSCDWCPEPIAPGEIYARWCAVDARDFWMTKLHPECNEAVDREMRANGEHSDFVSWGELHLRGKTLEESGGWQ